MAGPQFAQLPFVEQRQPGGKQFAVDHAFGQAAGNPEAHPLAEFGQRLIQPFHIARLGVLGAVAHHHPVHLAALVCDGCHRPLLARFPDQLGIERQLAHLESLSIDLADQVEINETVIERRDQRVCFGGGVPCKRIIAAGGIEDQEVGVLAEFGDLCIQLRQRLTVKHFEPCAGQRDAAAALSLGAVFQIAVQRALARIKIKRGNPRALISQRDRDVDRRGRFAGPALFIGEDNTVRAGMRSHVG